MKCTALIISTATLAAGVALAAQRSWTPVEATVASAGLRSESPQNDRDAGKTFYRPIVVYEYDFGDVRHKSGIEVVPAPDGIRPVPEFASDIFVSTWNSVVKHRYQMLNGFENSVLNAVESNDLATLEVLITNRVSTDILDESGRTPLDLSVQLQETGAPRQASIIEFLMSHGFHPDQVNLLGETAFHNVESVAAFTTLMKRGSAINKKDFFGRTPIHSFLEKGIVNENLLSLLVKSGVEPDAFYYAAMNEAESLVKGVRASPPFWRTCRLPISRKNLFDIAESWGATDCVAVLNDYEIRRSQSKVVSSNNNLCLGTFSESSKPSGVWILHNESVDANSVVAIQRTCGCLLLEYGEETAVGIRWRSVTGAADESFPPIPPGGSAQLRVSIAPFGRIGPFAKNVYVKTSDSEKPVVLTVTGDSRPLLEATPLSPLVVGSVMRGVSTTYTAEISPTETEVAVGEPYVTNAVCPAVCALDTNAVPWILSVTLSPPADYRGPVGCDVRIPVVRPAGYREMNYSIQGTTVTREELKRIRDARKGRTDIRRLDVFRSPHCRICPGLERDLFDRLDLLPGWDVRYHDIDAPAEAAFLMEVKRRLHGTRNDPVNVLLDGETLLEGEAEIRAGLSVP